MRARLYFARLGFRRILSVGLLSLVVALTAPRLAYAIGHDVRTVIVAGEYGILGGTILGVASLPFTQDARSIFIGSSIGLYLGIVVGVMYAFNRYQDEGPKAYYQRRSTERDPYLEPKLLPVAGVPSVTVPVLRF